MSSCNTTEPFNIGVKMKTVISCLLTSLVSASALANGILSAPTSQYTCAQLQEQLRTQGILTFQRGTFLGIPVYKDYFLNATTAPRVGCMSRDDVSPASVTTSDMKQCNVGFECIPSGT